MGRRSTKGKLQEAKKGKLKKKTHYAHLWKKERGVQTPKEKPQLIQE